MRSHWERGTAIPKVVDREERRANIAEAILRIAVTRGLEEVSLRDVAAEAGVSMGQVQHYFSTKREMMLFTCGYIVQQTRQAIAETVAGDPSARAGLRATMIRLLPLDDARRSAVWVWLAFLSRGVVEPEIQDAMRSIWDDSHGHMAARMRDALARGELPAGRDPDKEAVLALSFVDGLTPHVLIGHYSAEAAVAAVDAFLDRVLTGAERTRGRAGSDTD